MANAFTEICIKLKTDGNFKLSQNRLKKDDSERMMLRTSSVLVYNWDKIRKEGKVTRRT